jgi:ribonuclease D
VPPVRARAAARRDTPSRGDPVAIHLYQNDLPAHIAFGDAVAIDSETMGLNLVRDRLCLVQLSAGDGDCHLVQFAEGDFDAPNLKRLLTDPQVTKIFHYARFDLAMLERHLGVETAPVYCTKTASKLVRTYTDKHGLKDLCKELLGVELSKQQQSSDWGAAELSENQMNYAAADVLYLHELRRNLDGLLAREGRSTLARQIFDFLPVRARLDLMGWGEVDIFAHS